VKQVNRRFTNPASISPPSGAPSSFDEIVEELDLSPEDYASSAILREWVFRNKDQRYVPPELLKAYGFEVKGDL